MESAKPPIRVRRLARFGLTTPNAYQLSEFYRNILDFRLLGIERRSGVDFEKLMHVEGGAAAITLRLGDEVVEILQFDQPGRPYPKNAVSSDLCFQHFAIVVADIDAAYQKLVAAAGWTPISIDGPQKLPMSSGGVTAFKFRDPDGHPLELLAFPGGQTPAVWQSRSRSQLFLGIDHSAISVADGTVSVAFYKGLGLHVASRSLNAGLEQERLDAISDVQVEVMPLEPEQPTPHIELLNYRSITHGYSNVLCNNDVAATRLIFDVDTSSSESATTLVLIDPDGHHLVISTAIDAFLPTNVPVNADLPAGFVKPEQAS